MGKFDFWLPTHLIEDFSRMYIYTLIYLYTSAGYDTYTHYQRLYKFKGFGYGFLVQGVRVSGPHESIEAMGNVASGVGFL